MRRKKFHVHDCKVTFKLKQAVSVSANGKAGLTASLGTDIGRITGLDGLGENQEIGPTGKSITEMTSPSRKIMER